jgi:hypothetical protein
MRAVFHFFRDGQTSPQGLTGGETFGNWMIAEVFLMARMSPGHILSNVVTLSRAGCGSRSEDERRCVAGLSYEETIEFEALDAFPPLDAGGNVAWTFEGDPTTHREKRWLELYNKHDRALKPARTLSGW